MSDINRTRGERLQIMLTPEELMLIDDFRFKHRMPSRAAAVREILTRGLSALGFATPKQGVHSNDFAVSTDRRAQKEE
jgi:hypothetical protein